MSYCRFSNESDLYCYKSMEGGWKTHVVFKASFNDDNLQDFRERLLSLRKAGLRFPDSVLSRIDAEIENNNN